MKLKLKLKLSLILWMAFSACQAHAATSYCVAEMEAQAALNLSPEQRERLEFYKTFNRNDRYYVGQTLVRAHLVKDDAASWKPDDSPVSACLLKLLADANSGAEGAYAREAYALRLLAGTGVAKDRALAISYLERSSSLDYRSAKMQLARLYLADKNNPESREKAVQWLERAATEFGSNEVGGWSANPADSVPLLFDIYLPSKGPKDYAAAENFYRMLAAKKYSSTVLDPYAARIPGLKAKLEAERQAALEARNDRRNSSSSGPRKKTCVRYYNGYQDCRYE